MRGRHGENDIIKLEKCPDLTGYEAEPANGGTLVIGHSESGHHHSLVADKEPLQATLYRKKGLEVAVLVLGSRANLEHTIAARHKTVSLAAGAYAVSVKRQYAPDGSWAPVVD